MWRYLTLALIIVLSATMASSAKADESQNNETNVSLDHHYQAQYQKFEVIKGLMQEKFEALKSALDSPQAKSVTLVQRAGLMALIETANFQMSRVQETCFPQTVNGFSGESVNKNECLERFDAMKDAFLKFASNCEKDGTNNPLCQFHENYFSSAEERFGFDPTK